MSNVHRRSFLALLGLAPFATKLGLPAPVVPVDEAIAMAPLVKPLRPLNLFQAGNMIFEGVIIREVPEA